MASLTTPGMGSSHDGEGHLVHKGIEAVAYDLEGDGVYVAGEHTRPPGGQDSGDDSAYGKARLEGYVSGFLYLEPVLDPERQRPLPLYP